MSARYVASLDASARRRAEEHTWSLWGEGRSFEAHAAYQEEQLERATPALLSYAGLVGSDGALLASLKRFTLSFSVGGEAVPTIGIGAVMVPEPDRGNGRGRTLVRAALDDARARGFRLAWLFSEIEPAYYERLGFFRVGWSIFACQVADLPEVTSFARHEPLVDGGNMLDALDQRRFERSQVVRPKRSPASRAYFDWRNGIETAWLCRDDGAPAGYVSFVSRPGAGASEHAEGALEVSDWGFLDATPSERLGALRMVATSRGRAFVAGTLGTDWVDERFTPFASDAHGIPMLCLLDPSLELCGRETSGTLPGHAAHFTLGDYF